MSNSQEWETCVACGSACELSNFHIVSGLCPQCRKRHVQSIDNAVKLVLERERRAKTAKKIVSKLTTISLILLFISSCSTNKKIIKPESINNPSNSKELFSNKSSLSWMKETTRLANLVSTNEDFLKEISEIKEFDLSSSSGVDVVNSLKSGHCIGTTYKTRNPFSKVTATTYSSNKTTFYMNTRNNPRSYKSMVNTFIHECLHLLGYSHGSNSRNGKENTVNYKIGKISENYVE